MVDSIQRTFNKYQKKYPLYNKNALVDKMVEDGTITVDTAKKIKAGASLFVIDNRAEMSSLLNENHDINITEIIGFKQNNNNKDIKVKANFNKQIEPTFQGNQGDCWLLSDINALNRTDWGKNLIRNAIVPDTDGSGGVTIKFPGSLLPQKNFHITPQDIQDAKQSGHYSSGDDDMVAFELATEKVIKALVKTGKAKRVDEFDHIIGYQSYLSGAVLDEKSNIQLSIASLLGAKQNVHVDIGLSEILNTNDKNKLLKKLSQNKDDYSITVTFNHLFDAFDMREKDDPVHGNHSYALKEIVYGKYVTVIDPYHSDQEIRLSWDKFMYDVESLYINSKDDTARKSLENALPQDYYEKRQEDLDNLYNDKAKRQREQAEIKQRNEQERIRLETNSILDDVGWDLLSIKNEFSYTNIQNLMNKINKDTVLPVLKAKPDLILTLDDYKSGWGNGDAKKALMTPIIDSLAEKAADKNINPKLINEFKTKCFKELDATFYTDEKIIQAEVEKMINLINSI